MVLSTQHKTPMVDSVTGMPEIILYYNSTKGGVDVVDAMIERHMGKPPLRRWPTTVWFFMLSTAQVNSTTILLLNRGQGAAEVRNSARREMTFNLGHGLINPRLQERIANPVGLNRPTLMALACATGTEVSTRSEQDQPSRMSKGRCALCLERLMGTSGFRQQKNKMTKKPPCEVCGNYVCKEHSKMVCVLCAGQ